MHFMKFSPDSLSICNNEKPDIIYISSTFSFTLLESLIAVISGAALSCLVSEIQIICDLKDQGPEITWNAMASELVWL